MKKFAVPYSVHYAITRGGVIIILVPWIIAMILKFEYAIALIISVVLVAVYYILIYMFVATKEEK